MNTPIQLHRIYRSRNGAIHRVTSIDAGGFRPVVTELLSGPPDTTRIFTETGHEVHTPRGHPQPQRPSDLVEDITSQYVSEEALADEIRSKGFCDRAMGLDTPEARHTA